ncbi:ribonuclease HIII [Tannockella kyphosi]|uniref:ribonuclease HIII n=1 Tax=Tannockella kyphosi TaxID=2899121 RepID=UPI002012C2A3|nr:ribonuclease HIII [Tannockella kyphosi]
MLNKSIFNFPLASDNLKYSPVTDQSSNNSYFYSHSHIGCEESGSGDFFGPLCVVSCYVDERDFDWLMSIGLKDSKDCTDQEIITLAREIKDRVIYSLLMLDNSHYNQMASEGNNLATIKAKLYNQAITNVMQKLQLPVACKAISQFVSPKTYFNYLKGEVIVVKDLTFDPKGETRHIGIICAGILSRYACLQYLANMQKSLKIKIPRGTSATSEQVAIELAKKYGMNILVKVTKNNLTSYKRVKEALSK